MWLTFGTPALAVFVTDLFIHPDIFCFCFYDNVFVTDLFIHPDIFCFCFLTNLSQKQKNG
jgi:hypothetical protein